MYKKIILAVIALLFLVLAFAFCNRPEIQDSSDKLIKLSIKTAEKTVLDASFNTKANTLKELLIELKDEQELLMDYENQSYGMYIKALGKDELYYEDMSRGLYWIYSSDNNKVCQASAFCPVADEITLENGDEFVFSLISYAS